MNEFLKENNPSSSNKNGDEINLHEVYDFLSNNIKTIFFITLVFSILSVIYSLSLPNIYKSESILASSSITSNSNGLAQQYSSIASLAGINIPDSSSSAKIDASIEVIKSLDFFQRFIKKHNLLLEIYAVEGWDDENNELIVNPDYYDVKKNEWVYDGKFSVDGVPSIQSAHEKFHNDFKVQKDINSGFVYISFEHYSPYVAKKILDLIIEEINLKTKEEDLDVANKLTEYLQKELEKTQIKDIRLLLSNLMEKQLETIALANAKTSYLYKVLSNPIAPERKEKPQRSVIVVFSSFLGLLLGLAYSLIVNSSFFRDKRPQNL